MVGEDKTVTIEYTLKLDDGTVVDTSEGREPLQYQHGTQQILPALEDALEGMLVDQTLNVTLSPDRGYGAVDPTLVHEVPISEIPEEARKAGTQLVSEDPQGGRRLASVREVREETILIDLNHPLAGKTIHFDVRVVAIE